MQTEKKMAKEIQMMPKILEKMLKVEQVIISSDRNSLSCMFLDELCSNSALIQQQLLSRIFRKSKFSAYFVNAFGILFETKLKICQVKI